MVRHIVMWKLKNRQEGSRLKEALEALRGRIPGLLDIRVGLDFLHSEQSADMVLIADLENRVALDVYQKHPLHQAVIPMMREATLSRTVVDFEL